MLACAVADRQRWHETAPDAEPELVDVVAPEQGAYASVPGVVVSAPHAVPVQHASYAPVPGMAHAPQPVAAWQQTAQHAPQHALPPVALEEPVRVT